MWRSVFEGGLGELRYALRERETSTPPLCWWTLPRHHLTYCSNLGMLRKWRSNICLSDAEAHSEGGSGELRHALGDADAPLLMVIWKRRSNISLLEVDVQVKAIFGEPAAGERHVPYERGARTTLLMGLKVLPKLRPNVSFSGVVKEVLSNCLWSVRERKTSLPLWW